QEVVDFVGKNDLLKRHAPGPQPLGQVHRLAEGDVAVVVALDEEHGRFPGGNRGVRRRLKGQLGGGKSVGRIAGRPADSAKRGPVVNPVKVNTGGKDVGVPGQAHRGEKSAVGAAP